MNPTPEQTAAVTSAKNLCPEEVLILIAFAGAAKTTTLGLTAKALPAAKFLYLAFNKAIAQEAKSKFPANVTSQTTHSLAYGYTAKGVLRGDYRAVEIAGMFKAGYSEAEAIINVFERFCNSAATDIMQMQATSAVKQQAKRLYDSMLDGSIEMTHSFYLKAFHLYLHAGGKLNKSFDYILLDEAQDTNPVTFAIFQLLPGRKIMVGDRHQAIYSFRGAIDALDNVRARKAYQQHLTTTFRCLPHIVECANWVLGTMKNEKTKIVSGNNTNPREYQTKAIISRTNASLIGHIDELETFNLTRPPEILFDCLLSLYNWKTGNHSRISSQYKFLTEFKSQAILDSYIADTGDMELTQNSRLLARLNGHVVSLFSKAKGMYAKNGQFNTTLTTAHSSKGLEFDEIELTSDFPCFTDVLAELIKSKDIYTPNDFFTSKKPEVVTAREEVNLYYVAVTRAKYKVTDTTKNAQLYAERRTMNDIFGEAAVTAAKKQQQPR